MPPSSFASALAGNSQNDHPTRDGSSEWSRSRTNGATHTFRRSSTATSITSVLQHPDAGNPAAAVGGPSPRYVPPHRNGMLNDMRYSKDQLLDLFKAQSGPEAGPREDLASLYAGTWRPDSGNGGPNAAWNRGEQGRDGQPGPDICWDRDGQTEPLGLVEMDDDERELFSTSVNTPLKPPPGNKDNQQSNGHPGRKVSLSGQGGGVSISGPLSPTIGRGSARRRETGDSFPFPSNTVSTPTAGAGRDDPRTASPPPSLLRRKTDIRDSTKGSERDETDERSSWTPFGSLRRNPTGPLGGTIGAPASPWSTNAPPSAGLSPMGSFGNFGLGQQSAASDKRPALGSGRSESRFKDLLSRDGSEDVPFRAVERKGSISGLARVNENESWRPAQLPDKADASLDETDEDLPTGSAALGADADISPPHLPRHVGNRGFGTPSRGDSRDDFGFGAFGMTSDNVHGGIGAGFAQGRDAYQHSPSQSRHTGGNEPMSPTDTNPYQSPEQHGADRLMEDEHDGQDAMNPRLGGLGGFGGDPSQQFAGLGGLGALPNLGRGVSGPGVAGDRSQTSSVGPNRGLPGLGGLGQLGGLAGPAGWPQNPGVLATPSRQAAGISGPFSSGLFAASMGEMQSPSLAGLGSAGPFTGGRMANMFPPVGPDPMQQGEQDRDLGFRGAHQQFPGLGDQMRTVDGQFTSHPSDAHGDSERNIAQSGQSLQGDSSGQQPASQTQQLSSAASSQPPAPQQRTMVMPDRMRWIYRDPQGQTQGPWSGLEMHDWYKAGFFSPELLVKKLEDPEYEPLAQLIRRIGNSREPFLVPQIGIPHGQPSTSGPTAWAGPGSVGSASTSSTGAQPPFASSFPSFGTTLTAEQQNALERRKQEEQYLMARQKEHLAQAQMAQRMQHHPMQPGAVGGGLAPTGQLHHQHSGQSLHSQPSFGSIASPATTAAPYQPSPIQAPQGHVPGFFDNSFRAQGQAGGAGAGADALGQIREEELPGLMGRLNTGNRGAAGQFGSSGQPFPGQQQPPAGQEQHEQQVKKMLQDRARLQQEQELHNAQVQPSGDEASDRLQQFQQLQGQVSGRGLDARFPQPVGKQSAESLESQDQHQQELSLTEQVQKAASAQQSPAPQQPSFPRPFPPAPSQSPLPAPAAQRTGRQSVADQLQSEQRDSSQTPSIETPSVAIAPWAKEQTEASKGPSLKEIQEMEAKKAAEAEELAAAARRAAFQKEMELQAQAAAIATSGLPAGSTWAASGGSPATPVTAAAWTKAAQKASGPTAAQSMAQIQKEEEARKRRAAMTAAAAAAAVQPTAAANVAPIAGGKSYANLAGKTSAQPPAVMGGAWTTVGAGGKTKAPVVAAPATRAVSSGVVPTVAAAPAVRKPPVRSATMGSSGAPNAQDEFKKWAVSELGGDLNKGISAEDFVSSLLYLPPDSDIITEAVHGVSSTLDSRHFADEFIRRKRLADKGIVDTSAQPHKSSASPHNTPGADKSGGWSEVAKKGGQPRDAAAAAGAVAPRESEANGNFRVVAAKKKGGKR